MTSFIVHGGWILNSNSSNGVEFSCMPLFLKSFCAVDRSSEKMQQQEKETMRRRNVSFCTSSKAPTDMRPCCSRKFESQLENKPFFEDYLNAMESFRVEREKKLASGSKIPMLHDGFLRDTLRCIGLGRKKVPFRNRRKPEFMKESGTQQDPYRDSNACSSKGTVDSKIEECPVSKGIDEVNLLDASLDSVVPQQTFKDGNLSHRQLRSAGQQDEEREFKNQEAYIEEKFQNLVKRLDILDLDISKKEFSAMMKRAGVPFSDVAVTRLIQILSGLGNWRMVLRLIAWFNSLDRFKSNKYSSRYTYTAALVAFRRARRPAEALAVFHSMLTRPSSYPDLVAYHCIATILGESGYLNELLDIIDRMQTSPKMDPDVASMEEREMRLRPDMTVYDAVLKACVKQRKCEGAFWVLQELQRQLLQPSGTTYGLVMKVMFACGKYKLLYQVYHKALRERALCPLIYQVLISTLWKERKTDEAVMVAYEMERLGIMGNASLYYNLACCLCSAGRCEEAFLQIKKIRGNSEKSLVAGLTRMVQTCLDSGNIKNAAHVFQRMQEFCPPDVSTCNMMLNAYKNQKMFKQAEALFCSMFGCRKQVNYPTADMFSFDTMLHVCVTAKMWDDFEFFYKNMLNNGYSFDPKRHLSMLLEASWAGKGNLVEATMEGLSRENGRFPPALLKEHLCLKLAEKEYAASIAYVPGVSDDELPPFSKGAWLNLFNSRALQIPCENFMGLICMLEKNSLAAGGGTHDRVLGNLLTACREFLSRRARITQVSPIKLP